MNSRVRQGFSIIRQFSKSASKGPSKKVGNSVPPPSSTSAPGGINVDVPGLSDKVVKPFSEPLGPGASKTSEYKVPEYYAYHKMSYHEAEIEMAKYRCPQPSALKN